MPERRDVPAWFLDLLIKGRKLAGTRVRLAQILGVTGPTVIAWESGSMPGITHVEKLINYLGGDIMRALPEWQPETTPEIPTMRVAGRVAAGAVTWTEGRTVKRVSAWPALWKNSRYWPLTNPVQTPHGIEQVVLLEVYGNSMEPEYSSGEIIACRVPKDVNDLPEGTPVIIRDEDGETFKLLRRAIDGTVIGEPINRRDHHMIVFKHSRDLRVPFVVVGKLDPGVSGKKESLGVFHPAVRRGFA